jgi:hypothetical protein
MDREAAHVAALVGSGYLRILHSRASQPTRRGKADINIRCDDAASDVLANAGIAKQMPQDAAFQR